ncbi:hypothetical protein BC941DRAFT_507386 [Chlamydoabsidia padenii]|nr:hypothetical protein BC941DRAFT_507386 [Chlamydoabsidia padenii]
MEYQQEQEQEQDALSLYLHKPFDSYDAVKIFCINYSKKHNIDLTIVRSSQKEGKATVRCKHSGDYRNTRAQKEDEGTPTKSGGEDQDPTPAKPRMTQRFQCPYMLKFNRRVGGKWWITTLNAEHNHRKFSRTIFTNPQ